MRGGSSGICDHHRTFVRNHENLRRFGKDSTIPQEL